MEQALIGAGLGAVGSAVTGRDPIKGALLGGAGGGLFGGANKFLTGSLINGIGTNALAGGDVAKGLAMNASMLGANTVPASSVGKAVLANSIDDMGMMFNPATGTYLNPANYMAASSPLPVFTGGQGVFSNAMDVATNAIPDVLSKNLTPSNLIGVSNLLANIDQRPQMGASPISLSARPGQAPQQYTYNTGGLIRRA